MNHRSGHHRTLDQNKMDKKRKSLFHYGCLSISILGILFIPLAIYVVIFKPGVKDIVALEPDSSDAKKWFEDAFKFSCPDSVSKHYYAYYRRTRDPWYIHRFNCTDRDVIRKIINKHNLKQSKSESGLYAQGFPSWWPKNEELEDFKEVYKDEKQHEYYKFLWIDKDNGVIYFISGLL